MPLLETYVSRLIDKGHLDEWHIWDFTRSDSDRKYIRQNCGKIRYIRPNGGYQKVASLYKGDIKHIEFATSSDFHFALKYADSKEFTEFVASGWSNSRSVVQKLPSEKFNTSARSDDEIQWDLQTPRLLNAAVENSLDITFSKNGIFKSKVNNINFPDIDLDNIPTDHIDLYVRAGWGHSLELPNTNGTHQQFIGDIGESLPYFQAYQYYAERYAEFRDDIFLKCDDDIVYIDEAGFPGFIETIRQNTQYFIISENVINNGIFAHLQQKSGNIPE